ncbi:hypothetical protein JHK85_019746 [Glycine max]|nr:hypothetical protein JHK85_019746 [Glycine max]
MDTPSDAATSSTTTMTNADNSIFYYDEAGKNESWADADAIIVMDAFALPVEGTKTRVNAQADAYEYMVDYSQTNKQGSWRMLGDGITFTLGSEVVFVDVDGLGWVGALDHESSGTLCNIHQIEKRRKNLVTSIHENWFSATCINTSKPAGEGYCSEYGQHLLVYEFHKNGSQHDFIHLPDEYSKPLIWNSRVKIALGTALALEYLHEVSPPSVVHKNIKSANILLDTELNPHLSDSGLASYIPNADQRMISSLFELIHLSSETPSPPALQPLAALKLPINVTLTALQPHG